MNPSDWKVAKSIFYFYFLFFLFFTVLPFHIHGFQFQCPLLHSAPFVSFNIGTDNSSVSGLKWIEFFTQPPTIRMRMFYRCFLRNGRRRMRISFGDVFFLFFFVFFCFFFVRQKYETIVLGNGWMDFYLPNDTGENIVWNVVPLLGEWRMLMICVIYDMTLSQSPEGATHGGCVIQQTDSAANLL